MLKKSLKKLPIFLYLLTILFSCAHASNYESFTKEKLYSQNQAVIDTKPTIKISTESAASIVDKMKFGWNLGNTFDAFNKGQPIDGFLGCPNNAGLSTQTSWGQPTTTIEMIKGIKSKGFNTIRIPISWHGHFIDNNYTIDPKWMNRVKQVVDWAIEEDLYVIINIHHDNVTPKKLSYGKGFSPSNTNKNESLRFLYNVWCQITTAFNNGYDEHLIFETINEPRLPGDKHEWNYDENCSTCKEAMKCLNEYNQLILDTIRESGGNNKNRVVMFPSYVASPIAAFKSSFKIPTDTTNDKLALSVHMYTPYSFAMQNPGETTFTDNHKGDLNYHFKELNSRFVKKGIPVVIGEMGATNKNNLEQRKQWFEYFLTKAKEYKMAACLWDNGNWQIPSSGSFEELYGYYNRKQQTWFFPGLVKTGIDARE